MDHTIRFRQQHKRKKYLVTVTKPTDTFLSVYLAKYIFLSSMKKDSALKYFLSSEGKPTPNLLRDLKNIRVVGISEVGKELIDLFKEEVQQ